MAVRVGIIGPGKDAAGWQRECAARLAAVPGVEVALTIDADRPAPAADALARVRAAGLDLLLDLACGIADPALHGATRFGTWSFHHGDGERWSPGPITEWMPWCAGTALHAALIATTGDGTAPRALVEACLPLGPQRWPQAAGGVLWCAAEWPARVVREALESGESPLSRATLAAFAPPPAGAPARIAHHARRFVAESARRLRRFAHDWREDQWTIGVAPAPIHAFLAGSVPAPVAWMPERSRREYYADPFALRQGDDVTVLCERFDDRALRGSICAVPLGADGRFGPPRPALALPAHLSYPYLFEDDGRRLCVPELAQSGGLQLFERDAAGQWRFVATLLDGVPVVDPTLVRHDGRMWLFATTLPQSEAALGIWWARSLAGPWHAHRRNPVKLDVRSARPAGTPFVHEGALYRPAQDCSRTYGGALAINRVLRLTPDEFAETTVAVLRPDPRGPYPAGLHTLSACGERTLVDGKRRRWRFPWEPRGFAPADREALARALDESQASGRNTRASAPA